MILFLLNFIRNIYFIYIKYLRISITYITFYAIGAKWFYDSYSYKNKTKRHFHCYISRQWYAISCNTRMDECYCTHIKYDELVDGEKSIFE